MKKLGIAITLVSFILLSGCKDKHEPERQVVAVEKVGVENMEIYGEYVGQIRAKGFVEVRARVEGYLEQMLFEEGKRVKRNQPLFKINSDLYQARVDKAKAQLAKDLAQEAKAERDVERLRPLYEQKAASQLDLDNAVAAYESAKANVAMSKADLAQAELELNFIHNQRYFLLHIAVLTDMGEKKKRKNYFLILKNSNAMISKCSRNCFNARE